MAWPPPKCGEKRAFYPIGRAGELPASYGYTTKCHFQKLCKRCGFCWNENSDYPEPITKCFKCGGWQLTRFNFVLEVWHFSDVNKMDLFQTMGMKTYHKHYYVTDSEDYMDKYNTLQIDDMLGDL